MRKFLVGTLGAFFSLCVCIPKVRADEQRLSFSIDPAFQEVQLTDQQTKVEVRVKLHNLTSTNQHVELFALDFHQTDDKGNVALVDKVNNTFSLASYIEIPQKEMTLLPNSTEEIHAFVLNKKDLEPGGHYAAIIARFSVGESQKDVQRVFPGLSSLILLRKVGGERFNLSIASTTLPSSSILFHLPNSFNMTFANEGNIHIIPHGIVEIEDIFHRTIYRGIINDASHYILPGTRRELQVTLKKLRLGFPLVMYNIKIDGTGNIGDVQFHQQQTYIYVSPFILFVTVCAIGILVVPHVVKRKRNS